MFDPNVLAQMEFPDDITVGDAISFTENSEAWKRFRTCYPVAALRFYYRELQQPVDPAMPIGQARKLIKQKVIVVSISDDSRDPER
jgi:hypothetical protein